MMWKLLAVGILCTVCATLPVQGTNPYIENCPDRISIVTSHCLAQYQAKVHHMQHGTRNFYTGIDMEDIRSICVAMQRGVRCIADTQDACPHLQDDPIYPSDVIAVYNLCHTENFYEAYAISRVCYATVSSSTTRCYERFESRTLGQIPDVEFPSTVRNYCSHFDELVSCAWAIVTAHCGAEASALTEALVRPAVSHSNTCLQDIETITTLKPISISTTHKLYRYKEDSDKDKETFVNQQRNENNQLENDSNSMKYNHWIYLTVLVLAAFVKHSLLR